MDFVSGGVCAAKGFRANGICCGLAGKSEDSDPGNCNGENSSEKKSFPASEGKKDLALIVADKPCTAAAVYTTNKVKGAPLAVTKEHIKNGIARAVIVNSVNANTCNPDGIEKARKMCELAAGELGIDEDDVIVASTGVIGRKLPIEPIENGIKELVEGLSRDGGGRAVQAIMTTDTVEKQVAVRFEVGGKTCTIGGMLKGSGMINPNMATTLTFITTDADITAELLQRALNDTVRVTLNRVSVDGDTSTNDMVCILASGVAGNIGIKKENEDFEIFERALYAVMVNLSRMMARDGEGATKLIECVCTGAVSENDAEAVAKTVIKSNLFKAAVFGEDAYWGRILCAVGYSAADIDVEKVDITISSENGSIPLCHAGNGLDYSEEKASRIMKSDEIIVNINVGNGKGKAVAWGCDLTYDYVKINGEYRS